MTISVTTETKLFYDKEGLLWKKSIMMGRQFYYENRILLSTLEKLEESSGVDNSSSICEGRSSVEKISQDF